MKEATMHLTLAIGLWFIFISQGSSGDEHAGNDLCSTIKNTYLPVSTDHSLWEGLKDIISPPSNCSSEIITDPTFPAMSFYLYYPCLQLRLNYLCTSDLCFCSNVYLNISPTCNTTYARQNCPPGGNRNTKMYSCQTLTNVSLSPSTQLWGDCSIWQNTEDLVVVIQLKATGLNNEESELVLTEVKCNTRSVTLGKPTSMTTAASASTTDASSTTITPTLWNYSSSATTAEITYQPAIESTPKPDVIIGVVVGVGGAVLLTTAIVIIIVVLRRRRAESNKLHTNNASQVTASASSETAYATKASYTIPVSAAYDNATNGTTSNYESIADDNEEVGESNHAYTEIKEISDHNGYDNREIGRSDAYAMCKETDKDYDIVNESQSENTETETTVIDNEFYG